MKKIQKDVVDYVKIGERIRSFRKKSHLSQEQLAEAVDISTTHLSHIETANTKLSLSVFVKLSKALSVSANSLLYDTPENFPIIREDLISALEQCSTDEILILSEIIHSSIHALRQYR